MNPINHIHGAWDNSNAKSFVVSASQHPSPLKILNISQKPL